MSGIFDSEVFAKKQVAWVFSTRHWDSFIVQNKGCLEWGIIGWSRTEDRHKSIDDFLSAVNQPGIF